MYILICIFLFQAFPKVVQYDPMLGSFHEVGKEQNSFTYLQPSEDADNESKQREKILKWVKKERLPRFLKTQLYLKFKLCRLLLRKLKDFRSTARGSSRGLRGYSRATSSTFYSPQANRPASNVSNRSWPEVPVRHFGRRPLGSATSLPGMLRLALGDNTNEYNETTEPTRIEDPAQIDQESGQVEQTNNQDGAKDATEQLVYDRDEGSKKSLYQKSLSGHHRKPIRVFTRNLDNFHLENQAHDIDNGSDLEAEDELRAVMDFDEPDEAQTEADAKSIASKHKITLQELKDQALGSLQGMTLFRAFLEDTVGVHLYDFWLDVEQYKDSLQSEPEERTREHRTRLFREIVDKYKNYLTPDAKEQIDRALFHGGVTQDLFTRTQYDMLRRLRSYWVPRFLVHLERNEDYRENYFARVNPRDQYRPNSTLSFFPSLSLVHSIPPLGDWCREMIRSRKWDRDILITDKRRTSVIQRLNAIPQGTLVDPFMSALKSEKDAGYPFKRYLQGQDRALLAHICFWLDVKEFYAAEKRSGDRYLSRCNAWNIFNSYLASGTELNIGLRATERKRVEQILQSTDELPVNLFATVENGVVGVLRITWEDFKDYDHQRYRKPPKSTSDRISSTAVSQNDKMNASHYYSPTTGRWVKRHPGSSPSERGRRLYTSLAMAEEIDVTRSSSSSPKRSFIPPPPSLGKKTKGTKDKKKTKTNKNVVFRRKKKTATVVTDSDEEDSDSTEDKPEKPARPVEPDFVDVVENKGTMTAFKQYVQNMEGRQAFNQLVMYLEIEQYNAILPSKKMQKAQQSSNIYKTFFDPSSRRSVPLPSQLLSGVDAERPTTPILTDAQQAVKADVETYFKSFFKQAQDSMHRRGDTMPSTPNQGSKIEGLDTQQSFLQFYRRKTQKKTKDLYNYLDDTSLNRKVETIIECFLDSATPPWLQIDIGSELAAKIIHKAQTFTTAKKASREHKDPALFDEAQVILFKELLPYWAGFCKRYKSPVDESGVKLP
ncbi:hypothetical protein QZH41_017433, partial [Actinostola sp. cb2023]